MSKLNLDSILEPTSKTEILLESSLITSTSTSEVAKTIDPSVLDTVIKEWSYRCRRGYPVFGDSQDMQVLQTVLSEMKIILSNDFYPASTAEYTLTEANVELPRPNVATNETSLKEGLVCLFFDCFKNTTLKTSIIKLNELKRSKIGKGFDISKESELKPTIKEISSIFKSNASNYGVGKSSVSNLDDYINWCWLTGNDLNTLNNAITAANSIHTSITKNGTIIRNQQFDAVRKLAVDLIKQDYNITMLPDNWCPGDVYIVVNETSLAKALSAKSLNVDPKNNLNSNFAEKNEIIAISLKEQEARAGKASTFADTVFTKDYKANLDKKELLGTSSNKTIVKVTASIARFSDYINGNLKAKRKKSYINALLKQGSIDKSVNILLKAAGMPVYATKDIITSEDETTFYKKNKKIFSDIEKAIEVLKDQYASEKQEKDTLKQFVNSRNAFINQLTTLNVKVDSTKSATFAAEIEKKMPDSKIKVFSMKTATYELASKIINKWSTDVENISPAYKKISAISNPFVALTAFAIAEAGINPSFWKVIGHNRGTTGEAHFFDSNAVISIDTTTSPIKLVDNPEQAGFYLSYVTKVGNKSYNTHLTFRFSSDIIRIEVEKFTEV